MLRTLSYFNIFFAVFYFMEYLQNSSYWIIAALICAMVYNWLVLLRLEKGFSSLRYLRLAAGGIAFVYAFFTGCSTLESLVSAIEEDYLDRSMMLMGGTALLFAGMILLQLLISAFDEYSKKSD